MTDPRSLARAARDFLDDMRKDDPAIPRFESLDGAQQEQAMGLTRQWQLAKDHAGLRAVLRQALADTRVR